MNDLCTDNRFELIERYKQKLIESTNIETAPDEMAVLDSIMFRFWQMGWLDILEAQDVPDTNVVDTISRQAAIDFIDAGHLCNPNEPRWSDNEIVNFLKSRPSAQPEKTVYIPETKAIPTARSCVDLAEKVTATYYNEEYEEWTQQTVTIADVLDSVCDEYTILPSAQPEPIRINLNEPIRVKLTDCGKEIYYHQYDRTNQIAGREICKPRFPREDENGYTEFQLWCFIELYGMHMGMTLPNVIEPLEIVYER